MCKCRAIPKKLRLVFAIAYRDALQEQMKVLDESQEKGQEGFKRHIEREIGRLRAEFNKTQARIMTMRGRLVLDDGEKSRSKKTTDDCP